MSLNYPPSLPGIILSFPGSHQWYSCCTSEKLHRDHLDFTDLVKGIPLPQGDLQPPPELHWMQ